MSDSMSDNRGVFAATSARSTLQNLKNDDAILSNRVNPEEVIAQFKKKIEESAAKLQACKTSKYPDVARMERLEDIIGELQNSIKMCEQRIK